MPKNFFISHIQLMYRNWLQLYGMNMLRAWKKKTSHECNIRGKISGRKWYKNIGMNQSSVGCSNGTVVNLIILLPRFIILKHEKKITNYEATNYILSSVFLLLNVYPPGHRTYGPAQAVSCLWKTFCFRFTVSVHKVARVKSECIPNFLYTFFAARCCCTQKVSA